MANNNYLAKKNISIVKKSSILQPSLIAAAHSINTLSSSNFRNSRLKISLTSTYSKTKQRIFFHQHPTINPHLSLQSQTEDTQIQLKPPKLGSLESSPRNKPPLTHSRSIQYMKVSVPRLRTRKQQEILHQHVRTNPKLIWATLQKPIDPQMALSTFGWVLSAYQKSEILQYQEVYYIGLLKPHILKDQFDDSQGNFIVEKNDHIAFRFQILETIGSGTFGKVLKVHDHKQNKLQALKVIKNQQSFAQQAKIQIEILKFITVKDHTQKLIHLNYMFKFRNHTILVFDLYSVNLYQLIRQNSFRGVPMLMIRRFGVQILQALKFHETNGIIHCDLKPENVILQSLNRSSIKVIDYGSSCYFNEKIHTYIQSRFYRAPEIIFGIQYTQAIDIWSFGCILYQLWTGRPLFRCKNQKQHIAKMIRMLGYPPIHLLKKTKRSKFFLQRNFKFGFQQKNWDNKGIIQKLEGADCFFIDLVSKCLQWDPQKRITASQALDHKWSSSKTHIRTLSPQKPHFFQLSVNKSPIRPAKLASRRRNLNSYQYNQ